MNTINTTATIAVRSPRVRISIPLTFCAAFAVFCPPSLAGAQPQPPPQSTSPKSEAEQLVPPQGSAIDVPVHAGTVCILSFPEKLAPKAITSSADFDIQAWGQDGIAVRAVNEKASPSTLALATATGLIKINATLRVVPSTELALTLVRFKAASEAEAFDAQVKSGVAKAMAPLEQELAKKLQELAKKQQELDALIIKQADRDIVDRVLRRTEVSKLDIHARNNDHVILHLGRSVFLGEDGYIVFEIQNRSGSPYELAAVRVLSEGRNVGGEARLLSTSFVTPRSPSPIGVVGPHTTARGVVAIRTVQRVLNRPLTLEVSSPSGRGTIRIDRIGLK